MTEPKHTTDCHGTQEWRADGKLHRLDGPARVWDNDTQSWWVNGKRHRLDGPAVIFSNGHYDWFVDSKRYNNNKTFQEAAKLTDEEMMIMILKYGSVK